MAVLAVDGEHFEEGVLHSEKPVLVDFSAPWCGYCRRLAPAVARLAEKYGDRLAVKTVDIDEAPQLAEHYGVDTIPTLRLFAGGRASEPLVNPGSAAEIENWLRENGAL